MPFLTRLRSMSRLADRLARRRPPGLGAGFKAWVDHICGVALPGESQKDRRRLIRTLLTSAWDFANWLTHTKSSKWNDAEAAGETTGHAASLAMSAVIQHVRGVPETCPACGSHRLSPQRAHDEEGNEWERMGAPNV